MTTGIVKTTKPLDREKTPEFDICIRISNEMSVLQVKDRKRAAGDPLDTSKIDVKITIGDEDDNGPSYAHFTGNTITIGMWFSSLLLAKMT